MRTSLHPRQRLSWRVSSRMQLVCGCSSQMVGGNFWARIQKSGGLGDGWDGALVMRQTTNALRRISCPSCSRCSHLESGALFPLSLCLAVIVPGVWVLLMSTENWNFWEMTFFVGAMLGTTLDTCPASVLCWLWTNFSIFYVAADSDPEAFFLHSV